MSLNFIDEEGLLFAKQPRVTEHMFTRLDKRETGVGGKIFRILYSENSDLDWLIDDPNGNNNYREIVGLSVGFELGESQTVAMFANINPQLPQEFNNGEIHGVDIKIVVDGTSDAGSERSQVFDIDGRALAALDYPIEVVTAQTKQTLAAGYHRVSVRAQGREPTSDWWARIPAGNANLIVILGG